VTEAVSTNWYAHAGDFVGRFERAFAAHVGRRHAVSLPSCTSALHLSLLALGVGPGDQVVLPELTWIASAAPVSYVGAEPVFVDVDPVTWCMDASSFEAAITDRTRAVIPVDLYGGMPDMDRLLAAAGAAGVAVIEDAAEAIGASWNGRPAGAFGATSVFSFHGSKTLTTGEGGMLVTDDDAILERVLTLRDHGRAPGSTDFRNTEIGQKYKMTSMQAALGLAQLERVDELASRKRQIFKWYDDRLGGCAWATLNAEPEGMRNGYWMVTVVVDPELDVHKEDLRAGLDAAGIDSRPFFDPLSDLQAYAGTAAAAAGQANAAARRLSPYGVNLPSALCLTEDDVDRVCSSLVAVVGR
jgi:perosamine synthetase